MNQDKDPNQSHPDDMTPLSVPLGRIFRDLEQNATIHPDDEEVVTVPEPEEEPEEAEPTTVEQIAALTLQINTLYAEYERTKNPETLRRVDKLKEQRFWHEEELNGPSLEP